MKLLNASLLLTFGLAFGLQAQSPGSISATIQVNNVKAVVNSNGTLFSDGQHGRFVPIQPGLPQISLLNGSGLWVAGFDQAGNLKGSVAVNGHTDFKPGIFNDAHSMPLDSFNNIWPVTCSDISQHKADFNDNGIINTPNAHVYGYPAKGNRFFEAYNNHLQVPFDVYSMAGFYDGDEDGFYGPEYGDYPSIAMRGCTEDHYPTEMDCFFFNDVTEHPSGLSSLKLEILTQVLAYNSPSQPALNDAIYVLYRIINFSDERLDSCYFGLFADFHIGNANDDFMGTIPAKNIMYGYNADANDEGGFGTSIPVMAVDMLRGPLDSTGNYVPLRHMMAVENVNNLQPSQYYNLLSGHFADGSPAPNGGMMYPDIPYNPGGNSEVALGNTPGRRVGLASYGPLTLMPYADNEIVVAYYFVHTPGATPLQDVEKLYNGGPSDVQALFDNCFDNMDQNCDGLIATHERPLAAALSVYPNPASESFVVESKGEAFGHLELTDLLGRQLRSIHLSSPVQQYTIQTADLPTGVYVLQVEGALRKVVVER